MSAQQEQLGSKPDSMLSELEIRKEIQSLTVPNYFPTYVKECKQVAETFFACFSSRSIKVQKGDRLVGVRGLQICSNELLGYKECMDKKQ